MRNLCIVLALLAHAASAWADGAGWARHHYRSGVALYQKARYAEALQEFQAAKAALDEPAFDFNIGKCLARLGRPADAADALERYMRKKPNDPEAADVWRQIAELRAEAARSPAAGAGAAALVAPSSSVAAPPPDAPSAGTHSFLSTPRGLATLVVGVAGGAMLIAGAATGGASLATRSRYDQGCDAGRCDGSLYDQGRAMAISSDVLLSVGAVAAVTAVVLWATRPRPAATRAALDGTFAVHF
jgi:tetratricopeptide (TPR) repeat protein